MNSTEEFAIYKENSNYNSPVRRGYDIPDKLRKREKKWSISSIFRKKKKDDTDTSSDEESQKNFFGLRRRKPQPKKKPAKTVGTFDHIVVPPTYRPLEESGIMSDPSVRVSSYTEIRRDPVTDAKLTLTPQSLDRMKKSRREQAKVRAAARRTSSRQASSSEEESLQSNSSQKDSNESRMASRRSRSARTERYLKRRSRDGENPYNYLKLSKSDTERSNLCPASCGESSRSQSRSPLMPNSLAPENLTPPPHANCNRCHSNNSIGTKEVVHNRFVRENLPELRSNSYDSNIHRAFSDRLLHVQCPVVKPNTSRYGSPTTFRDSWQSSAVKPPPTPPPRDPNRVNNGRPDSYLFNAGRTDHYLYHSNSLGSNPKRHSAFNSSPKSISPSGVPRPFSTSLDTDKPKQLKDVDNFDYLTSKSPRSRRPIIIQPTDHWAKKERQKNSINTPAVNQNRTNSPQIFVSQVNTQVYPILRDDVNNNNYAIKNNKTEEPEKENKKPSNLEDALNELEEIYNSLRLGDEDLLERAEQREKEAQAKEIMDLHPNYSARGALSDSSFSYEPFHTLDSPRRKRLSKKQRNANIKEDDMAFRKLYKKRSTTINDPQSVVAQVSYLMTSPMNHTHYDDEVLHNSQKEPDITHDDVLYRNIKHANNSLKIVEPQPPFGIPLGPISSASGSDYLHAKPESFVYRPLYKRKKVPDIIKDDLAFRNLRKDNNKVPVLPPNSFDSTSNLRYLQKKRAQRSKSANIGDLLERSNGNIDGYCASEFGRLTNIADAMEIARMVLKEKENKIASTRKGFKSDTDAKYNTTWPNAYKPQKPHGDLYHSLKKASYREVTPFPGIEDKIPANGESLTSSVEDMLSVLAEEAKRTTESISEELKLLQEKKEELERLEAEENKRRQMTETENKSDNKVDSLTRRLSDIEAVSNHAKMCEKLLETAINNGSEGTTITAETDAINKRKSEFIPGLHEFSDAVNKIQIPTSEERDEADREVEYVLVTGLKEFDNVASRSKTGEGGTGESNVPKMRITEDGNGEGKAVTDDEPDYENVEKKTDDNNDSEPTYENVDAICKKENSEAKKHIMRSRTPCERSNLKPDVVAVGKNRSVSM